MSSIPSDAIGFGAESISESPISFSKTRVSGKAQVTYILHSKGGCMPGQQEIFTTNSLTKPRVGESVKANQITRAYKREKYLQAFNPIGPKYQSSCLDGFTFDRFNPDEIISDRG